MTKRKSIKVESIRFVPQKESWLWESKRKGYTLQLVQSGSDRTNKDGSPKWSAEVDYADESEGWISGGYRATPKAAVSALIKIMRKRQERLGSILKRLE